MYKVDRPWSAADEGGIRWNDPDLALPWPVRDPIVSDKDAQLPTFATVRRSLRSPAPGPKDEDMSKT
jgi:dTDP-4-dehydrorhamnose 3,5-epimerase